MEISGKIIAVLPLQSGTGKSGKEWSKQEYVIKTADQYPKHCCFCVWNDKIETFGIAEGQDLDVSINIDAREWQGRWFNEVQAWKVVQRNVQQAAPTAITSAAPAELFNPSEDKDDLPF